jgi:hypothetical protein
MAPCTPRRLRCHSDEAKPQTPPATPCDCQHNTQKYGGQWDLPKPTRSQAPEPGRKATQLKCSANRQVVQASLDSGATERTAQHCAYLGAVSEGFDRQRARAGGLLCVIHTTNSSTTG